MRYVILLAYDGTAYGGWQVQKNTVSVQEKVEGALCEILGAHANVIASGRTDSGVHAAGQVCHFDAQTTIPATRFADALNMRLPQDIAVLKSAAAPENFDANRSAKKKTYCYRAYFSTRRNPLKDRCMAWVKGGVDIAKLKHIAARFVGIHNFKAYCASGSAVKTYEREIYEVRVESSQTHGSLNVEIYVTGNGFLYNMVRTIAGTMIYYSQGVLQESDVVRSIEQCDRSAVGKTMPANGLTLENVDYGVELFSE